MKSLFGTSEFFNVRDLGGHLTSSGKITNPQIFVRSALLDHVTDAGWAALQAYGITTIVDLTNPDERTTQPPKDMFNVISAPLDNTQDVAMWQYIRTHLMNGGGPLYYKYFLEQQSQHIRGVMSQIANIPSGGILFHCKAGRDRTGLVSLLLLSLAGVSAAQIVEDYCLSANALKPLYVLTGRTNEDEAIDRLLAEKNTSVRELLMQLLENFDAEVYLREAGLSEMELQALKRRLL